MGKKRIILIFLVVILAGVGALSCSKPHQIPVGSWSFGVELMDLSAPYGAIILPNQSLNDKKYCRAFFSGLAIVEREQAISNERYVSTFWPLKEEGEINEIDLDQISSLIDWVSPEGCESATRNYNNLVALEFLTSYGGIEGQDYIGKPLLMARGRNSQEVLLLDLSIFQDEDLNRAFILWQTEIVQHPSAWNDLGWKIDVFRERFRTVFITYSPDIFEGIKTVQAGE